VILPMARVRILGPAKLLEPTLATLQDLELLHLAAPHEVPGLRPALVAGRAEREARQYERLAAELDALAAAGIARIAPAAQPADRPAAARWARLARRVRRQVASLDAERASLEQGRSELARYEAFAAAFADLLPRLRADGGVRTWDLLLRPEPAVLAGLRAALGEVLGEGYELVTAELPTGELAAVLLVPAREAGRVEGLLLRAGVDEMPLPPGVEGHTPAEALAGLGARRAALERELGGLDTRRAALVREHGLELGQARAAVGDRLMGMTARRLAAETPHTFVLEGWLPADDRPRLAAQLARRVPGPVVLEEVEREEWEGEPAPVVLRNPRLFRPFESLTAMMPLPAYGSIDATPFVAVFFPMFFGLVLGDVGYGLVLAAIALVLRRLGKPGTPLRSVSEVAGACAAFSVAFGLAFGELFGDLGRHLFGLHPLLFDREEELMSFLGLVLALGIVHIVLGLVLGAVNAFRGHHRRHALGSGVSAAMVVLLLVVLLAAFQVLPRSFFTPAVVVLLAVFPVLVVAEGIIAPLEFLSTLSNILSYARIMALGTASVMMAVVANQLVGTFGSVTVGVLFAVLFHLVNFAIGVFAPTIHGLRLHYVEFFGKFYSPGGVPYRPFGHWRPPRPNAA